MMPERSLTASRCLTMMIRHPEPGQVKTRLAKAYNDDFAAELYGCFVEDLLNRLEQDRFQLALAFTPAEKSREIRRRFGDQFRYFPQEGDDLGARMDRAFSVCFARGFAAVVLIGSDVPDLPGEVVEEAFSALERGAEAVLGPAFDGGYYLIGFRSNAFEPAVFAGIPWGENTVFERSANILRERGLRLYLTQPWRDIDTAEDLKDFRARHGNTAFRRSRTMTLLCDRLEDSHEDRLS